MDDYNFYCASNVDSSDFLKTMIKMRLIRCASVGLQNPTSTMNNTSCLCGKDCYWMINLGGLWVALGLVAR